MKFLACNFLCLTKLKLRKSIGKLQQILYFEHNKVNLNAKINTLYHLKSETPKDLFVKMISN